MIGYGFQTLQVCHVILSFYSPAVFRCIPKRDAEWQTMNTEHS